MSELTCGTCVYWDRTRSVLIDADEPACVRHEEDALRAENERLRAALEKYGRHVAVCETRYWSGECNCGLHAALEVSYEYQV
jgi:hypothetical protein